MKTYIVTVTNTWRVLVDAKDEKEARLKIMKDVNNGYNEAQDFDGAEVIEIEEEEA